MKTNKENLYETKRKISILSSKDDSIDTGEEYTVYMNAASTLGIIDNKGAFIPLLMLQCWNVNWEYAGRGGQEWS